MQDAHPINVSLKIVDSQYNNLKTFDLSTSKKEVLTFKDVILFTKTFFFEKYNKYQVFGSCNFSNLTFRHFQMISCNRTNIGDLSKQLPHGPVSIHIQAIGKAKKVQNKYQKSCFSKKKLTTLPILMTWLK